MSAPSLTIVVEWDNVDARDEPRARAVLARLAREADALGATVRKPVELILASDGAAPPVEERDGLRIVHVAEPGKRYYELKNAAAARAHGDLLVFLDSDVVPEPGWLARLLEPFADPEVQVVGGNAYIEPRGLWGKTFALMWFFPLRSESDELEPAPTFFANNVAFRRATFARFPFPAAPGTSRGSCTLLARALGASGITIYRAAGARVSHPAPSPFRPALVRALAQGRDRALLARDEGDVLPPGLAGQTLRRLVVDRRRVGLSATELPVAVALATVYYGVAAAGALATLARPRLTRRFRL